MINEPSPIEHNMKMKSIPIPPAIRETLSNVLVHCQNTSNDDVMAMNKSAIGKNNAPIRLKFFRFFKFMRMAFWSLVCSACHFL